MIRRYVVLLSMTTLFCASGALACRSDSFNPAWDPTQFHQSLNTDVVLARRRGAGGNPFHQPLIFDRANFDFPPAAMRHRMRRLEQHQAFCRLQFVHAPAECLAERSASARMPPAA